MKKLARKYMKVLDDLDWTVSGYEEDGRVSIGKYSPAGEDFDICVELNDFPSAVMSEAMDFDMDDHVEMWICARHSGVSSIPSVSELVEDAQAIKEMLCELADALVSA